MRTSLTTHFRMKQASFLRSRLHRTRWSDAKLYRERYCGLKKSALGTPAHFRLQVMDMILQKGHIKKAQKHCVTKAFIKWWKLFPLQLKCDEIARQLQERTQIVHTLRESYLRDVVSIKYHLEKVAEQAKVEDKSTELDMYDLHTLPSANFRNLIQRAMDSKNPTSLQLHETLIRAGWLNASGAPSNPWNRSHIYKLEKKKQVGALVKFDKIGGESLPLAAPSSHCLYVRYCTECVGALTFIRGWDTDVEEALGLRSNYLKLMPEINNMKSTIGRLNDIIADQERDIVKLMTRNAELERSTKWMEEWTHMEALKAAERELRNQLSIVKHRLGMAQADKESTAYNAELRFQADFEELRRRDVALSAALQHERDEKRVERTAKLEALSQLQEAHARSEESATVLAALQVQLSAADDDLEAALAPVRAEASRLVALRAEDQAALHVFEERVKRHESAEKAFVAREVDHFKQLEKLTVDVRQSTHHCSHSPTPCRCVCVCINIYAYICVYVC